MATMRIIKHTLLLVALGVGAGAIYLLIPNQGHHAGEVSIRPGVRAPTTDKPNIVLVVADDLGIGSVGAYGSTHVRTPNIDELAARGFVATNANATASVCTPSRFSMLSGRLMSRYFSPALRKWEGEQMLAHAGYKTIAHVLKERGYDTAYFGKWHLGWGERDGRAMRAAIEWDNTLPTGVIEAGFDTFYGTPFSHSEAPWVFVENKQVVGFDPNDPVRILPANGTLTPNDLGASAGAQAAHRARPTTDIDRIVTNKAIEWLGQTRDKPFFLHLALVAPHVPYDPQREFVGHSDIGAYGDVIEQLDHHLGRLLKALDDLAARDNTLVVFTSDNGAVIHSEPLRFGLYANGELLGQKTDLWEGGHRVPFIVSWPGRIRAGTSGDKLISLSDLPATLAAATDGSLPDLMADDSIDQLPYLTGETSHGLRRWMMVTGTRANQGILTQRYAFINDAGSGGETTGGGQWYLSLPAMARSNSDIGDNGLPRDGHPPVQLYDLDADPGQTVNIQAERPGVVRQLANRLAIFRQYMWEGQRGYPPNMDPRTPIAQALQQTPQAVEAADQAAL